MPEWNDGWPAYVSVGQRRDRVARQVELLRRVGLQVQPVAPGEYDDRRSVWRAAWCTHLESFSDYANRLPRGRSYVRHGAVVHLEIAPNMIRALVDGSRTYFVDIAITPLAAATWRNVRRTCSGRIGSMLELLEGRISGEVMDVVADRRDGLFPQPSEIKLHCTCPDWAVMCKHVAAVLYGVGVRLDREPELLFTLRDVDPSELITGGVEVSAAGDEARSDVLPEEDLGAIFGVEFEGLTAPTVVAGDFEPTGAAIRRLRLESKLSVAEFADRVGVTAASVYRWERVDGRLRLRGKALAALRGLAGETDR